MSPDRGRTIAERFGQGNRPGLVTEADWVPSFWNFLLKLEREDLIAELVQNDLDQGATRTVISFERNRLVCEGNGRPVDADGWKRLRSIQGAGDEVPAKSRKIGVKNHGLKTAFTIGDEIRVSSAGCSIIQTLYARNPSEAPRPGTSEEPEPDRGAPDEGCRVVISYRNTDLEPPVGEAIRLAAVNTGDIDDLFTSARDATPEQFAGIVSPDFAPRYEIVIRHWRLGEARFRFSCSRPRRVGRLEIFRRNCGVSGTTSGLPNNLQEEVARRLLPLRGRLRERAADFFRRGVRGNRFLVEVSWPINTRGRPRAGVGRFRYPIGYPAMSEESRTGHGVSLNAPIVSDTQRHGPATNDPTNPELRDVCESVLVEALVRHVLPKWGASGLEPLAPAKSSEDAVVRPLLAALARRGALPTVGRDEALALLSRGRSSRRQTVGPRIPGSSGRRRRYRFVVPVASWTKQGVEPLLAAVCPRSERQLDPRVPNDLVRLLADEDTDGYGEHFVDFREEDAFDVVTHGGNEYFDHVGPPWTELANPVFARAYLDVIATSLREGKCDGSTEDALLAAIKLPDSFRTARPWSELYTGASVPPDIPGLGTPPLLHGDVASHSLLRRRKWRRPEYTFREFLTAGELGQAGDETRRRFWNWLRQNGSSVPRTQRGKLADLVIWPDTAGRLRMLDGLCEPRSRRVAAILSDVISRPHDHVRRSPLVVRRRGRRMSLRRTPSVDEVGSWLDERLRALPDDARPKTTTITALRRLQSDLAFLLKDATTARGLRAAGVSLPALAQDGSIQRRGNLVGLSRSANRLALRRRFLLKGTRHDRSLNSLCAPLAEPTADMLLKTFAEDPANSNALQARLEQFEAVTTAGGRLHGQLESMAILPADGRLQMPRELAFTGPVDYWGEWKIRASVQGLSQADQGRYRMAGVTSWRPTFETSQEFFEWLSGQDRRVIERHIPCALRHILHAAGPAEWAASHPDAAFVPVEGQGGTSMASLRMVRDGLVFLRDAQGLATMVTERDPGVLVAIDRTRSVRRPVTAILRRLGVRSLWEALGGPKLVSRRGTESAPPDDVLDALDRLRSTVFRRTFLKGLAGLGVDTELVWRDWPSRLSRIKSVRVADVVVAGYRLRRKSYEVEVEAGLDSESGVLWVKRDRHGSGALYRALAAQLVFKPVARPVDLAALEWVLDSEVDDPSYGRPARVSRPAEDGPQAEGSAGNDEREDDADGTLGEALSGHAPFTPDHSRNVPNPGPIPKSSGARPRGNAKPGVAPTVRSEGGQVAVPTPQLEKVQVMDLKANQYATHCQMCLCRNSPDELAPVRSYIESEEVRRRVIDAHHVDLKSAGGARHAGNLVLLCRLHHENYGRQLTRAAVLAALKRRHGSRTVRFVGGQDIKEITGEVVELEITGKDGDKVELFFTEPHANYWRSFEPGDG